MKSALTQSLATGTSAPKPQQGGGLSSKTLASAFPCIAFGNGEDDTSARSMSPASSTENVAEAFEALDLDNIVLAGSAPTGGGLNIHGQQLVSAVCCVLCECVLLARAYSFRGARSHTLSYFAIM